MKVLKANEVKLRETETSLRTDVDKAVRSKGELEVSAKGIGAIKSHLSIYTSLLLTLKIKVEKLIANLKEAEKTKTALEGEVDKKGAELEKMKRLKEDLEVSDVCFSSYDNTSTV